MGLLDQTGAAPVSGSASVGASVVTKKKGNGDYQRELKAKQRAGANRILKSGVVTDPQDKAFLEWMCREPGAGRGSQAFGPSVLTQVFGEKPAVGAVVTLAQVFERTGGRKSSTQMDSQIKKWKEKHGIVVEFALNKEKRAQSTYTLKVLPNS